VIALEPGADGQRLVLVRHGQTPSNVAGVLDTALPGPGLTEEGQQQAAALAERLAAEKIAAIHTSRARRAQETARPLADRHGLEPGVLHGTHEVQVGELEGRGDAAARQRFDDVYAAWHLGRLDRPMPGGETGRQALTRFAESAQEALSDGLPGAIVLVSHGAMVRLVAAQLSAEIGGERANAAYLPNTGVIVLEPDAQSPTGWRCAHWDDLPV